MHHRSNHKSLTEAIRSRRLVESLEPRQFLTVTFTGTAGDDVIALSTNVSGSIQHVVINGVDNTTTDLRVIVNAGGGNDEFDILEAGTRIGSTIDLNGEAGSDLLRNIGGDLHNNFRGSLLFNGGDGSDRLFASNASATTTGETFIMTGDQIGAPDGALFLDHQAVEDITFEDGGGSNRIEFDDVDTIPRLTIKGNGGNDTFANHAAGADGYMPDSLPNIELLVIGGAGSDLLSLDDAISGSLRKYTINSTLLQYDSPFGDSAVVYSELETFGLAETNSDDVTTVNGLAAGVQLSIDTTDGADTVTVGGGAISSSGLKVSNTTVFGGSGNDSIEFDDHLNTAGESYTMDNFSVAAGTGGVMYGGFEKQTLDLADAAIPASFTPTNNVNINAVSSQLDSTTVKGGSTHVELVNVGNGNLTNVAGTLTLQNCGIVNFKDQLDTGNDNYALSPTQLVKTFPGSTATQTFNYSGTTALTLLANQGVNNVTVNNVAAGMSMSITDSAGAGSAYHLGGGNIAANLLGPVSVTGPGSGGVVFENGSDTAPSNQTLNGGSFTDGQTHTVSNVGSIALVNGGGGGTINVNRVTISTQLNNCGIVNIGAGDLDANLLTGMSVIGAGEVNVDDRLDKGNDSYTVDCSLSASPTVSFSKTTTTAWSVGMTFVGNMNLQANNFDNLIRVVHAPAGVRLFGNGGNDDFAVLNTAPFFSVQTIGIDTGAENTSVSPFGDMVRVNSTSTSPVKVQLLASDALRKVSADPNGTFIVPATVVCKTQDLILSGGSIDLAGGALLNPGGAASLAAFRSLLISGRNGGAWNGTSTSGANNSSLAASSSLHDAVGCGAGSQIALASIGPFTIAPGDALVRYTLEGDANLDHVVDLTDFTLLASNFNGTGKIWTQADFDYSGGVDLTDFTLLASNFNQSVPAAAPQASGQGMSLVEDVVG
jgi:hypothetical protein